jgi:hypothetical protein
MAITGTKVKSSSGGNKPYFINKCYIVAAEQIESQYSDTTVKLELEDSENGYKSNVFINQNFIKDNNGVVTDLAYPDLVNTLYLAAGKDLDVSDIGDINLDVLANAEVAALSYPCTGKYKRALWNRLSSWDDMDSLGSDFEKSLAQGYPKNYKKPVDEVIAAKPQAQRTETTQSQSYSVDDLPF